MPKLCLRQRQHRFLKSIREAVGEVEHAHQHVRLIGLNKAAKTLAVAVAGNAQEAELAGLLLLDQPGKDPVRFQRATHVADPQVVEVDQVDAISLQQLERRAQRLFRIRDRVRGDLAGKKNLLAATAQPPSHSLLRLSIPASRVKIPYSGIQGNLNHRGNVFDRNIAREAGGARPHRQCRDRLLRLPENAAGRLLLQNGGRPWFHRARRVRSQQHSAGGQTGVLDKGPARNVTALVFKHIQVLS